MIHRRGSREFASRFEIALVAVSFPRGVAQQVDECRVQPFAGAALPAPVTTQSAFANLLPNAAGLLARKTSYLFGGYDPAPHRRYMELHRDTIITGFALMLVLYVIWQILF